jgi:hypothetical protein
MKLIGDNLPCRTAFKDISEYLKSKNIKIMDKYKDVWVVTPNQLENKGTRKLNKELGLSNINKFGYHMVRRKNNIGSICKNCRFVEEMHLAPKDLICMNSECDIEFSKDLDCDNYMGVVEPNETCKLFKKHTNI